MQPTNGMLNQRQMARQPRMQPGAQIMPPPGAPPGPQPGSPAPPMPSQTGQSGQAMAATPMPAPAPGPAQPAMPSPAPVTPAVTGQPGQQGGNQNQNAIAANASPTGGVGANLPQTPGFRPRRPSMGPPGAAPTGPNPMSTS